ncbi:protein of unknown function [Shewanella benthica]|uniref:Uncharacterized protein n=1 Tax=Shewanella benthica TaxID=43661 RepID=A0A330M099_9GAMM|nr:protein of unknown function [Shewanella benthica]
MSYGHGYFNGPNYYFSDNRGAHLVDTSLPQQASGEPGTY